MCEPLKYENVVIELNEENGASLLKFSGAIDMRDPSQKITPYLGRIHKHLIKNNVKELTADFTDLEFMNSSGIKTVISWIISLKDTDEAKRYKLTIIYDPDSTWQKSSVYVINRLFPDLVFMESR